VLVDALTAGESARRLVEHFLRLRMHVTSANKTPIAEHGCALAGLARDSGGVLRYSAAVGGVIPMIEAVDRMVERGPLTSVTAVLNGTCNFVLDRCVEGATL
jgi:homoserine dehydrogenase